MKRIGIARLGLVMASLTAAALSTEARAAEEGELVKGLLGAIGVIDQDKDPINYRERAPLVLPPRMDLPPPVAPGSAEARNPQWPNDPDVAARARREAEERVLPTDTEARKMNRKNARLSVEEMRAGRIAGTSLQTTPATRTENAWIHPDALRSLDKRSTTAQADDDTTRRSLTDPPSTYRKPVSGKPLKATWEPRTRVDEADPKVFLREQAARRGQ